MSEKISAIQVYKLLPGINCRRCGTTCMGFAVKLIQKEAKLEQCTPLFEESKYSEKLSKLSSLLKPLMETSETLIDVDVDKCIGCGNCVIACPANISIEPQIAKGVNPRSSDVVFTVENGKIKILNIQKCRRYPPSRMNCRICELVCYSNAIKILG